MKKLLAPLTLLFLVACQPSELEKCIESNKQTFENNFMEKFEPYITSKWINSTLEIAIGADNKIENSNLTLKFSESLNEMENAMWGCKIFVVPEKFPRLSDARKIDMLLELVKEECMPGGGFFEEEFYDEPATKICNAQGIY